MGVSPRQPVRRLGHAQRLGRDADPRAVHQRNHVSNQTPLAFADQKRRAIVENQFAGGRSVDAQLVLQVPNFDFFRPLGIQQAQAAAVGNVGFAAGKHQQDIAATVGDEPLHAVEKPVALLVLIRPQSHGLQIAAGVGLGEHHGPGDFAAAKAGKRHVFDPVVGKGVDRFGDALQPKQVRQRSIGPADDLGGHGVDQVRAI